MIPFNPKKLTRLAALLLLLLVLVAGAMVHHWLGFASDNLVSLFFIVGVPYGVGIYLVYRYGK